MQRCGDMKRHATMRTQRGAPQEDSIPGSAEAESRESGVYKGLKPRLELRLYLEGNREPLRNLSGGWGIVRFQGQCHSKTKQKGESALSAKKQRSNSPAPFPGSFIRLKYSSV